MKAKPFHFLFLAVLVGLISIRSSSGQQNIQSIVATQGIARVGGEDLLVTVLVAVGPGENGRAKASAALAAAHPGVQELDHDFFTTTGLDWNSSTTVNLLDGDGVPVQYNAAGEPASAYATLGDAMAMWGEVTTSYFQFGGLGTTTRAPSLVKESPGRQVRDGYNDVGWGDIKGKGTLGVTWSTTSGEPEFDMMLDNHNFNWRVTPRGGPSPASNQIDLLTVSAHEFGHALGLGHTEVPDSIMQAYYDETFIRQLGDDDIAGVSCLYPATDYVCGGDNGGGDPQPGDISVASIDMVRVGRKGRDLQINVFLESAVAGVVVEGLLEEVECGTGETGATYTGADQTNDSGVASFRLRRAGNNTYQFTVESVDGAVPAGESFATECP